jgi:hypothetical protein
MRAAALRSIAPEIDRSTLQDAMALCARNAASKGDNDVLPWSPEFRILRAYTSEIANAVWAATDAPGMEEVIVPLSRLTQRYAHLVDPATYLRLFGPLLVLAERLEPVRASVDIATAARWAPNRSRGRILRPGAYALWDEGLSRLEREFPYVLHLDLATFFPSLGPEIIYAALAPFGRSEADLFIDELKRTGIRGLPVGSGPARFVSEAVLHKVDVALAQLGRRHVRAMDDMAIGVENEGDAEAVIVRVAEVVRPLDLNKSKTKVRKVVPAVSDANPSEVVRRLLAEHDPDRVHLARALFRIRQEIPGWDLRKRRRWLRLLVDAVPRLRVRVPQILRLIEKLIPGTEGPEWEPLYNLLRSSEPLHRAEAARFLSRQGRGVEGELTRNAVADTSPLARREALFGLVRLNAKAEVEGLVRGDPPTELDRGAWIVAAGVMKLPVKLVTPYQKLLHHAASEHTPREI